MLKASTPEAIREYRAGLSSVRGAPTLGLVFAQEALLYLRVDSVQPLLGALRMSLMSCDLGLEFRNSVLGCAQLMRKSLYCFGCLSAAVFHHTSGFI